jgi:hypothetical protein
VIDPTGLMHVYVAYHYGGADDIVNTPADADLLGAGLATRSDYQALWTGLSAAEQDYMVRQEDANSPTWRQRLGIFITSWKYGGANHAIDTAAERDAALSDSSALTNAAAENFWAGIAPADQSGIKAYIEGNLTELSQETTVDPVEAPSDADLAAVDATRSEASAAAYGTYGCRRTHDVTKVGLPGGNGILTFTSIMDVRFCWNKIKHKAAEPGSNRLRRVEIRIPPLMDVAGYKGEVLGPENDLSEQRTWNGYANGEIAQSKWFDIKACVAKGLLPCYTVARYYHATYGHYDGTATARVRLR